jgi:hypothetical protein
MKNIILTIAMITIASTVIAQGSKTVTTTESTTVTINNNERNYSLVATYDSSKREKIHNLIIKSIGASNETYDNQTSWKLKSTYTILLKRERLIIDLDKELASKEQVQQFDLLGAEIEQVLTPEKKTTKKGL